ncbi:hypothetical protein M9458_017377, partial [Cirrhinus mrigala]
STRSPVLPAPPWSIDSTPLAALCRSIPPALSASVLCLQFAPDLRLGRVSLGLRLGPPDLRCHRRLSVSASGSTSTCSATV